MNSKPLTEYAYSVDGERYTKDYQEVIDDLREDNLPGEEVWIYRATTIEYTHADFINVDYIVEQMQDNAIEEGLDWAEGYLDDVENDKGKLKDLEQHIANWFKDNSKDASFFTVENVERIKITMPNYENEEVE